MADAKDKLDQIDLGRITLDDISKLENSALREALLALARQPGQRLAAGHQNHGSHSNHNTEAAAFIDTQFVAREVVREMQAAVKDLARKG